MRDILILKEEKGGVYTPTYTITGTANALIVELQHRQSDRNFKLVITRSRARLIAKQTLDRLKNDPYNNILSMKCTCSIRGDNEEKWTEVYCNINIRKIPFTGIDAYVITIQQIRQDSDADDKDKCKLFQDVFTIDCAETENKLRMDTIKMFLYESYIAVEDLFK